VPRLVLGSSYSFWLGGLDVLNTRANALTLTDARDASALDPYAFTREAYFQRRKYVIFDGDPPEEFDDFFDDEEE
jgi:phospholipid-binding lipoprotein MlaA